MFLRVPSGFERTTSISVTEREAEDTMTMWGGNQRGSGTRRMSGIETPVPGDRDKLSSERRTFVIIGIALTQQSEHLTPSSDWEKVSDFLLLHYNLLRQIKQKYHLQLSKISSYIFFSWSKLQSCVPSPLTQCPMSGVRLTSLDLSNQSFSPRWFSSKVQQSEEAKIYHQNLINLD